jgi:hypothetical protein
MALFTCRTASIVTNNNTSFYDFWERKTNFNDLGRNPKSMTVLALQHNMASSDYWICIKICLTDRQRTMEMTQLKINEQPWAKTWMAIQYDPNLHL